MRLLHAAEVHSCTFKNKHSLYRFTVGRFYNAGGVMVSAFLRPRFNATRFQIIGIPKVFTPSYELASYIASILQIEEVLTIHTPDGIYDGVDFHTQKGAELDFKYLILGQQISEMLIDENIYSMVKYSNDSSWEVTFANFAGYNDVGQALWRIIPTPAAITRNENVLDEVLGLVEDFNSDFALASATFH